MDLTDSPAGGDSARKLPGAPLWLEHLVFAGCCAVLFFGGFGLLLAVIGQFSGPRALLLGAAGTVAAIAVGRPRRSSAPSSRPATLPALAMCGVAGGILVWNSKLIGHHVVVDTDPGVYATTGRWLADHGSLVVPAGTSWASTGLGLSFSSSGTYAHAGNTVQFQFAHFLPALLAEAYKVGGAALMFRTPAVLGAMGLLTIYVVGCRLISRPWVVVAAVTALGISLPELAVTRDTFSEPTTQVLLWFGIWLLIRCYEQRRFVVAVIAGLAVGGTVMTHIDAVIYLIPLPVLAALAWVTAKSPSERRSLLRVFAGVVLGALPPAVLGTVDVRDRSNGYYLVLRHDLTSLYRGLAVAAAGALIVAVAWPLLGPVRTMLTSQRRRLGIAAGWIVAIGLILAWSLRPAGPKAFGQPNPVIAALQAAEHVPVQPGRTYAEQSLRWIDWYIGPVGLALAIAGLGLLMAGIVRRGSARQVVLLAMTGPVTALYLWRPSLTPYQIWATRRFVPATLPLLLLAAGIILDAAATFFATRLDSPAWPRRTLAAGTVGLIAFPLGATLPVRNFQPQAQSFPLINSVCQTIGPHGAVLFPPGDFDGHVLAQPIRSWCNAPVASLKAPISQPQLSAAVTGLRGQGRTLWVLGASPGAILTAVPGLKAYELGYAANNSEIQPTLTKPASTTGGAAIAIWAARVGA